MKKILTILKSKITLYLVIGALAYFLFSTYQENEALEASKEVWEEKAANREREILNIYDSLEIEKRGARKEIEIREGKISDILISIDSLLKSGQNEKVIDNMRDPDSIAKLFARYYPDND